MAAPKGSTLFQFDADYLDALCRGDRATEDHFVSYFTPFLVNRFRRRLRDQENVEDGVNETFTRVLAAVRRAGVVRHPERFGAFVNALADNVRREFNRRRRYASLHDLAAEPQDTANSPDTGFISSEIGNGVRRVLRRLSPRDGGILTALYLQEQDKNDVCRQFGVNRGYLRVLLCRAKKEFRRQDRLSTAHTRRSTMHLPPSDLVH